MQDTAAWRVLCVDDEPEILNQLKRYLDDEPIAPSNLPLHIEIESNFQQALSRLEINRFDMVVLDVRVGPHGIDPTREDEVGIMTLKAIKERRFVPVVFYTGLPQLVLELESPLTRVVEKTEGVDKLLDVIKELFATRLPDVNRALVKHLEMIQREYMWDFVAEHWNRFSRGGRGSDLVYLLARRLAASLSSAGTEHLAAELGESSSTSIDKDCVHPMRCYLMPPLDEIPGAGDIFRQEAEGALSYWVLLTPSCDLAHHKAQYVLLASCRSLTNEPEYVEWRASQDSKSKKKKLQAMLKNNRENQPERYFFLPGVFDLPDLVVDFQQLRSVPCAALDAKTMTRVAALDSPFAEAILARFARYFGRLGTPDLDVEAVIGRLYDVDD